MLMHACLSGQTASGKTHTLMGSNDEPGIVPLSIQGIYAAISEAMHSKMVVRVSYIEVSHRHSSEKENRKEEPKYIKNQNK